MGMEYRAAAVSVEGTGSELPDPADLDELFESLDGGIDLDKMWHAAQVLIAGSLGAGEPLFTGRQVSDDYGTAYYASPDEVARAATRLVGVTRQELLGRSDPNVMIAESVYPDVWDRNEEGIYERVADAAMDLIELYRSASKQGQAIIAAIT
jgi:hypothetical protein